MNPNVLLNESKLTLAGGILVGSLVVIGLVCSAITGAFYAGQRYARGEVALKVIALGGMVDSATVKAQQLNVQFSEADHELASLRAPRVHRRRRPTDLTVGVGPLPEIKVPQIPVNTP